MFNHPSNHQPNLHESWCLQPAGLISPAQLQVVLPQLRPQALLQAAAAAFDQSLGQVCQRCQQNMV